MARENGTQESLLDRRSYLKLAGTAAATVLTATVATNTPTATTASTPDDNPHSGLRGAIYWPAQAYNHYQVWSEYDSEEIDRDFGYAADLNLNSLRVIMGWEYWRDHLKQFKRKLDHFLTTANKYNLQILPVFFESIGAEPTEKNLSDTNVLTSFAVKSPSTAVLTNTDLWEGPRQFVQWFTNNYGHHDAVIALEIMNEPVGKQGCVDFCRAMLRAARDADSSVPLTMGSREIRFNKKWSDPELDIYQFHHNLPVDTLDMEWELQKAEIFAKKRGKPIWLTEWQRTRKPEPPNKMLPNYSSLAETIYQSDIDGSHFWQLMLKPAYIDKPRKMGRLNGLLHADGAVYSADDARAIVGGDYHRTERKDWPTWAKPAKEQWAPTNPVYQGE